MGAAIIGVWTVARVVFWRRYGGRAATASRMSLRRRMLLILVSASLAPIYIHYTSSLLELFTLSAPRWIGWAGNMVLAAAVALFIWSHAALGSNWSVRVQVSAGQSLVAAGPYRFVRHPMYSSLFLMAFGLLLATANPVVALPYAASIASMYFDRVRDEERLMLESFGQQYADYMERTGRVVPRWGRGRDATSASS